MVRKIKRVSLVLLFSSYVDQFGGLYDMSMSIGWAAFAYWLLSFVNERAYSIKEFYVEHQIWDYSDCRNPKPNVFPKLKEDDNLRPILNLPFLTRVIVWNKLTNVYLARWEKERPEWLSPGMAEEEYFQRARIRSIGRFSTRSVHVSRARIG